MTGLYPVSAELPGWDELIGRIRGPVRASRRFPRNDKNGNGPRADAWDRLADAVARGTAHERADAWEHLICGPARDVPDETTEMTAILPIARGA